MGIESPSPWSAPVARGMWRRTHEVDNYLQFVEIDTAIIVFLRVRLVKMLLVRLEVLVIESVASRLPLTEFVLPLNV